MSKIKTKQINNFTSDVQGQFTAGAGISINSGTIASTITQYSDTETDARIAAKRNAANGICGLNANTLIDSQYLPALAITSVNVVANQAARLALVAQEGDVAIQTDDSSSWIYDGSSWVQFNTNVVSSVNTKTGVITLTTTDISEGTNQYFTTARARASFSAGSNITITNGVIASTASGGGSLPNFVTIAPVANDFSTTNTVVWVINGNITLPNPNIASAGQILFIKNSTQNNIVMTTSTYMLEAPSGTFNLNGYYSSLGLIKYNNQWMIL